MQFSHKAWTQAVVVSLCLGSALAACPVSAQEERDEVSGLAAAQAIEAAMVEVIAEAEKSVVAVARVRVRRPGAVFDLESRPDPFGRPSQSPTLPGPDDPDFVPNDYLTGVVIDRQGLILTTYRALGKDSEYYVITSDHRVFRAWIKGADPRSDLAVLAVEANDMTPIAFGDAERVRKGQIVIALGNPFAIANDGQVCASWGIVANLGRKAPPVSSSDEPTGKPTLHHFGTLIQTDARLSMSTDGGALVNLRGEMIGLLTALPALTGFEPAAGYAYPVDATLRRAIDRLKQGEEVEYGFLGVQPEDLTLDEQASGLQGTRVDRVVPGAPADHAGLKPRDLIVRVNNRPVYDQDGLVLAVGSLPVDTTVRLAVRRDERSLVIPARLSKYPVRGEKIVTQPRRRWRGMAVEYTTAMLESEELGVWGLPLDRPAVFVLEVEKDTPAWEAGLRRGMLISHVGDTPVRTPKELFRVVENRSGTVAVRLVDDGSPDFQPVRRVPAP